MNMEPNEPKYLPIRLAPGYMVSRDGTVARIKPYRVLKVLPFHDVMREVSKHAESRGLEHGPDLPPRPMLLFRTRNDASAQAREEWWRSTPSHATRLLSFHGDKRQGWVSLRVPLSEDGGEFVRMLLHGPSVAAFVYGNA
jgi:hypothetical protein